MLFLTLRNVECHNLKQNIQITQSHYVKLTLGYIKSLIKILIKIDFKMQNKMF